MIGIVVFCAPTALEVLGEETVPHLDGRPLVRVAAETATPTLFTSLSPDATGVTGLIRFDWRHDLGALFFTGFACGGIAAGDVDDNGLPDLFVADGPGSNHLYLQRTPWKFVDAAAECGLLGAANGPLGGDGWSVGAALFDIDNDGDLDLYVCNYDFPNALYVNRGNGRFDECAAEYGLDFIGASLMPAVCDFDRDGDLDIYLAINRIMEERRFTHDELFQSVDGFERLRPAAERWFHVFRHPDKPRQINMWIGGQDRLLRNEGPGRKFLDVSASLGLGRGDTLSATWWDYDHDLWPDLYIGHDLSAPDRLFHNEGDGSWIDVSAKSLPHTPWFSMGSSSGDVNNDQRVDLLAADMAFRTHFKDKVFMGSMDDKFENASYFDGDQQMHNCLYLNTGTARFQEGARLAGLAATNWTWSAKLADLDCDGRLDAFFTNGSPIHINSSEQAMPPPDDRAAIDTSDFRRLHRDLPPVVEQNLAFRNRGDLQFEETSRQWGLDDVGMSYGAVTVDLDCDGDLDLVVANLDAPPSIYRNESTSAVVCVKLRGRRSNRRGIGAEVAVATSLGVQIRQLYPVDGFLSCQEGMIHFGLGDVERIEQLSVRWPSGITQSFDDLHANVCYVIDEDDAATPMHASPLAPSEPLLQPLGDALAAEHHEETYDDYADQPLLPYKLSQWGPPMAWGDVDADGDVDLFVGEGAAWMGMLYVNDGLGRFEPNPQRALAADADYEDRAAQFFDADGDGDLDLYVASGSVECGPGDPLLRDRLYTNDGKGQFSSATDACLPDLRISGGAVAADDFDHDGDVDLFVGGRCIPGAYPLAPPHALLRNDDGRFVDVLADVAPQAAKAGMITSAVWADIDADGWNDLAASVDWGPVRVFRNEQGKLVDATTAMGLDKWTGWWLCLVATDFDADGDVDLAVGNFGLNTKYRASVDHPALLYCGEFGASEGRQLVEAAFEGDALFPVRGKSCSSAAMPHLAKRFPTYEAFAKAQLAEIYSSAELERSDRFEVNTLESVVFLNDGKGKFVQRPLPRAAQLAPVCGIAAAHIDDDAVADLLLAQNFFTTQRETGALDGGVSLVAIGRGDGSFVPLRADRSGLVVAGDAKAAAAVDVDGDGRQELFIGVNNGPFAAFGRRQAVALSPQSVAGKGRRSTWKEWRDVNLALARQFLATDQAAEAFPYVARVLKAAPREPEALRMMIDVRRAQRRQAEAQTRLQGGP